MAQKKNQRFRVLECWSEFIRWNMHTHTILRQFTFFLRWTAAPGQSQFCSWGCDTNPHHELWGQRKWRDLQLYSGGKQQPTRHFAVGSREGVSSPWVTHMYCEQGAVLEVHQKHLGEWESGLAGLVFLTWRKIAKVQVQLGVESALIRMGTGALQAQRRASNPN